jgi:hypothetical protein
MTARRAKPSDECVDEETLIQAALNRLQDEQRAGVIAHMAKCSDCAREYRIARSLRPTGMAGSSFTNRNWGLAAAAGIALLCFALLWSIVVQRRDAGTIAQLRQDLEAARQRPAPIATAAVEIPRPQLGVPIIDLDTDVPRGAGPVAPSVVVPATSDLFTLILHLEPMQGRTVDVTLADGDGRVLWNDRADWEPQSRTMTIAIHRRLVPKSGPYSIALQSEARRTTFDFQVQYR